MNTSTYQTKTEELFANKCPYSNASQGTAQRLLFVCSAGLLRSPTAASVGSSMGYNTRSCGSNTTLALIPISQNLILWADFIFFMNNSNEDQVLRYLASHDLNLHDVVMSKGICWDIEDIYNYGDDSLVWTIQKKLELFQKGHTFNARTKH